MDIASPEPPGQEQQISLLSLDRRMTVMETKQDMERVGREAFESRTEARMDARFDKLEGKLTAFTQENAEKRGTLRGVMLAATFLGSSAGTSVLLLLKHLMFGAS